MQSNKLYIRVGREDRGPAPKSSFIEAWIRYAGMCEWDADEEFAVDLAHGDIYEYHGADIGQGQDVRNAPQPVGCVCPPTSERTCLNQMCPRKPLPTTGPGESFGRLDDFRDPTYVYYSPPLDGHYFTADGIN